jgi:hypothetical protein
MTERRRWPTGLIAIGVVSAAAIARLAFLTADSLWLDEVFSVRLASEHSSADIWTGALDTRHPPLYYLILKASLRLFGVTEWAARLPSALSSLLNVGLVFVLAKTLGLSHRAAVTASILLAVAPLDVWYAREARMYALVATAALLFAIGLTMRSWAGPPIAVAALAAGVYLDYTMVPLACALVALWMVWWCREGSRPEGAIRLALAVLPAIWLCRGLWPHLAALAGDLYTVPVFARLTRITGVRWFQGGYLAVLLALTAGLLALAAVAVTKALERKRFTRVWIWIVSVGFAAATAASAVPRAYTVKQILVTGWPFVVVMAAWALTREEGTPDAGAIPAARVRRWLVVGVSCAALLVTLMTRRADWRGVAAYMEARGTRGGQVLVEPSWNTIPYDYYRPAHPARAASGVFNGSSRAPADVWLVVERFGPPPSSAIEAWFDRHWRLVETESFARLQVRHYSQQ